MQQPKYIIANYKYGDSEFRHDNCRDLWDFKKFHYLHGTLTLSEIERQRTPLCLLKKVEGNMYLHKINDEFLLDKFPSLTRILGTLGIWQAPNGINFNSIEYVEGDIAVIGANYANFENLKVIEGNLIILETENIFMPTLETVNGHIILGEHTKIAEFSQLKQAEQNILAKSENTQIIAHSLPKQNTMKNKQKRCKNLKGLKKHKQTETAKTFKAPHELLQ